MAVKRHFQLYVLVLVVVAVCFGFVFHYSTIGPAEGGLPPVSFYDKDNHKISLEDFRGKYVLVNLWATWCPPCVAELPSLARLQQKFPHERFEVVALSLDRSDFAAVKKFLRAKGGSQLDAYWDKDREVPLKWTYEGLPTSFLLDPEGRLIKRYTGSLEWDKGPVLTEIE